MKKFDFSSDLKDNLNKNYRNYIWNNFIYPKCMKDIEDTCLSSIMNIIRSNISTKLWDIRVKLYDSIEWGQNE